MRDVAYDLKLSDPDVRREKLLGRMRCDYDEIVRLDRRDGYRARRWADPTVERMARRALATNATMMPFRQTYANQLNDPLLTAVTSDTFTGPQDLTAGTHSAAAQPCIIPVNYLKAGTTIRTEAFGSFSTTGTPTFVFGVYYGTTALAVNVALTAASGAVTLPWHLRTITTVRSTAPDTACVTMTQGELWYGTTLTATTQIPVPGIALATVNVDNTAAQPWSAKATCSVSSASNIVVLHGFTVEELTQI